MYCQAKHSELSNIILSSYCSGRSELSSYYEESAADSIFGFSYKKRASDNQSPRKSCDGDSRFNRLASETDNLVTQVFLNVT